MKILLYVIIASFCAQSTFASSSSLQKKLIKRENIEGVKVVYGDHITEKYFEEEIDWGARINWGGVQKPFKYGAIDLQNLLDTFHMLVPTEIICNEMYSTGTIMTPSFDALNVCQVSYNVARKVWTLTISANFQSMGNVYEGADVLKEMPVSLTVTEK